MSEDSEAIERRIAETGWRGEMLGRLRDVVLSADPDVVEAVKWRKPTNPDGVAVWSHRGILCTGEIYKDKVKLTFNQGASLDDPTGLFNAGFNGKVRRAIDLFEGDDIDDAALTALIREAIAFDEASSNR